MNQSYVYYDKDTEEIVSISNHIKEFSNYPYVSVDLEAVRPILVGKKSLRDYKVIYNNEIKEYEFVSVLDLLDLHESSSQSWDESIYKIPTQTDVKDIDMIIEDRKDIWKIKFSKNIKKKYSNIDTFSVLEFYVTRKNDANVLLSKILIKISEIASKNYISIKKNEITDSYSIYCKKRFDSYLLVKNEN